jgi:hypothetical protein
LSRDASYGLAFFIAAAGMAFQATRGGWWLLCLWPSLSFLLVSLGYSLGLVDVFGKRPCGTRQKAIGVVQLPYPILARIAWELQTRFSGEQSWHAIGDSLIISRRLRAHEMPEGVATWVDLTCELVDPPSIRCLSGYRCIPVLDACAILPDTLVNLVRSLPSPSDGLLVIHCALGHGRSAQLAAAWMVCHGIAKDSSDAISLIRAARPGIGLRKCQRKSLEEAARLLVST